MGAGYKVTKEEGCAASEVLVNNYWNEMVRHSMKQWSYGDVWEMVVSWKGWIVGVA